MEAAVGILEKVELEYGTNASHQSQVAFGAQEQSLCLTPSSAAVMSFIATPGIPTRCEPPRLRAGAL
eukprot:12158894-Heterocapsa_arctica.AAC.1